MQEILLTAPAADPLRLIYCARESFTFTFWTRCAINRLFSKKVSYDGIPQRQVVGGPAQRRLALGRAAPRLGVLLSLRLDAGVVPLVLPPLRRIYKPNCHRHISPSLASPPTCSVPDRLAPGPEGGGRRFVTFLADVVVVDVSGRVPLRRLRLLRLAEGVRPLHYHGLGGGSFEGLAVEHLTFVSRDQEDSRSGSGFGGWDRHVPHRLPDYLPDRFQEGVSEVGRAEKRSIGDGIEKRSWICYLLDKT